MIKTTFLINPSGNLPGGADPLALLEEGLRPVAEAQLAEWSALSVEEVAAMLPAYEVRRMVGHGGMGAVYEAVQRDLQRRVAIKLLSPALAETPGLAVRFRYESRLMASLQHPGIVQVYEAGETAEGNLYYVMEYVDGEDLATRMRRERLPVEEAVPLLEQVANALHASHQLGIVHRDVKPANIFLSAHGVPRLGDFGLALTAEQAADPLRLTRAGTTVGTAEYAAPEQLARTHSITPASDVYSLGVLAYEMLTGELPRGNFDPPSVRNAAVDPAFDGVVLHALQSDPARRFADAGEFRAAFLHAADRRLQQALRDQAVRQKMLRRAWIVAALAAVSLTAGGSAALAWRARREADERRAAAESAEQRMAGLFQFLLTDLRQRLEPTGNLGAMDSVMEKAVEHFRRDYESAGRSPESALKLADVLIAKAQVIGVRGKEITAEQLHTEALSLCEPALRREPENLAFARRVFQARRDRAEHRRLSNNFAGAMDDAQRLLTEARALVQRQPDAPTRFMEVEACIALAAAHGHNDELEEAHQQFLRAQSLLKEISAAAPAEQEYADKLADLDTALGSNAEARSDFPEMLRHFTSWHDFVVNRHGRESEWYSYAAFRMGVALQKLRRPAEALPYLKDAVRIAERQCASLPGHKGLLNHLSWCLRLCAESHIDLGQSAEAAPLRQRGSEVNAQLAAAPDAGAGAGDSTAQAEFARLASDSTAGRAPWWAFCQSLQSTAASLPDATAVLQFYESWITRATAAAPVADTGNFIHLVPAFLHNRLADLYLEEDPARSGDHARQALALREAVAAAHPDDPELQRDVLSSACHTATAAVKGDSADAADAAFQKIAACARQIPETALTLQDNGLFYAGRSAVLLEAAAARWPDRAASFRQTGSAIAAALLDRLPPGTAQQEAVNGLRHRLAGSPPK